MGTDGKTLEQFINDVWFEKILGVIDKMDMGLNLKLAQKEMDEILEALEAAQEAEVE
jgi:hypothetical protein